jgi:hypothetical protein
MPIKTKSVRLMATVFALALVGCGAGTGPSAVGPYEVCHYSENLESEHYSSARMSYPCNFTEDQVAQGLVGPFPATTMIAGFRNPKEWIAQLTV